jgi:tetratricopeptide (TPR) repeat protein
MNKERMRRLLLIGGVALVVLAVVFNFIHSGGNIIPGVGRDERPTQVHDEYLRQQVLKAGDVFKKGDKKGAITILRPLAAKYPHEDFVFYMLGFSLLAENVYESNGKVKDISVADEGLSYIKKSIELAPHKIEYQLVYAVSLGELQRDKESVEIFERFFADKEFRAHPKHRYLVINYADSLARLGMREKALDEYQKSLAVTDKDEKIAVEYARLLKAK